MTSNDLYEFISDRKLGVMASVSDQGTPQSALVGIAVTRKLELVFDTLKSSRKYRNLIHNPQIAFVIGWTDEKSIQYEGLAKEISEKDDTYRRLYFEKFPGGFERIKNNDVTHFVVKPVWVRYSDYSTNPEYIREWAL